MILTPKQMAAAEKFAEQNGVTLGQLMDNAGLALSREAAAVAYKNMIKKAVVLCGKGNNGGDGLVCAELLSDMGMEVTAALVCGDPATDLAKAAFDKMSRRVTVAKEPTPEIFSGCGLVIDAVFGTGFHGELPDRIKEIFAAAEKCSGIKIACDCPSGVNCLDGSAAAGTLHCSKTVTFHAVKAGCLLKPSVGYCGEIVVCDIGIPEHPTDLIIQDLREGFPAAHLPERPSTGHKGNFGKLTAVCGSLKYRGAALLSCSAAVRSGVGMVEVCSPEEVINGMWTSLPEAIYCKTDMSDPDKAAEAVLARAENSTALLVGCGMGHSIETEKFMAALIKNCRIPMVIDADGINSICGNIDILMNAKAQVILTPHPGELARLCSVSVGEAAEKRLELAVGFARKTGAILSAKGADSFITDGKELFISRFGNTALSKGGSGDILAGITASFAAQRTAPLYAAAAAAVVLGKAAETLSENASCRSISGSDIVGSLPYVFKKLDI